MLKLEHWSLGHPVAHAVTSWIFLIRVATSAIVAGGYGGDMPEDQAYDILDDIDFYYDKVKCRKIEKLMPVLSKLVTEEQKFL